MTTENRRYPRREANRLALIMSPTRCTLADISGGGARLLVEHPESLPDEFVLELRVGLSRWCRVVRREPGQVGVQFVEPPQNYRFD